MNREQKSLTNKGFSLVELIIVVAIMAILIGVLAPQYLRYVEKSRLQKDNTSIGEVANVIKMSSGEEAVAEDLATLGATGCTIKFTTSAGPALTGVPDSLKNEINATVDKFDQMKLSSNTYGGATGGVTLTIKVDGTTKIMTIETDDWVAAPATGSSGVNKTHRTF